MSIPTSPVFGYSSGMTPPASSVNNYSPPSSPVSRSVDVVTTDGAYLSVPSHITACATSFEHMAQYGGAHQCGIDAETMRNVIRLMSDAAAEPPSPSGRLERTQVAWLSTAPESRLFNIARALVCLGATPLLRQRVAVAIAENACKAQLPLPQLVHRLQRTLDQDMTARVMGSSDVYVTCRLQDPAWVAAALSRSSAQQAA